MITRARYLQIKRKANRGEPISNAQLSQLEVYEFVHNPPNKCVVYVRRNIVSAGVVDRKVTVITIGGQILGYGKLGQMYRNRGALCYPLWFTGINEVDYRGILYHSSGNYARVRRTTL